MNYVVHNMFQLCQLNYVVVIYFKPYSVRFFKIGETSKRTCLENLGLCLGVVGTLV
jgi:hypothetical protein